MVGCSSVGLCLRLWFDSERAGHRPRVLLHHPLLHLPGQPRHASRTPSQHTQRLEPFTLNAQLCALTPVGAWVSTGAVWRDSAVRGLWHWLHALHRSVPRQVPDDSDARGAAAAVRELAEVVDDAVSEKHVT
eukprot:516035-Rhodomonas_salina.6